jgi:Arc/MetJ-type ribon-helix-helix transcriptional regulator
MRSLTVRLPDQLVREIEAESRERDCAKSDVVRERLQRGAGPTSSASARLNLIADLIGSVDGLPADMSARRKRYLKTTDYRKKPAR